MDFQNYQEHQVQDGETLDSIAKDAGMSWKELALFNWDTTIPREINTALHEFVGCEKLTQNGRNYMFTSQDDPGIVFIPEPSPTFELPTDKRHDITVDLARMYGRVQIQTVDEFSHRVPNVDLILRSEDGLPDVNITTDALGYAKKNKVKAGKYKILLNDGSPAWYRRKTENLTNQAGQMVFGNFVEAELDTKNYSRSLTTVVVRGTLSDAQRQEVTLVRQLHLRTGHSYSIQGREVQGDAGDATSGSSEPQRKPVTVRSSLLAVDNLAIAAGWNQDLSAVNIQKLVSDVIGGWVKDYYPTADRDGFYVILIQREAKTVEIWSKSGSREKTFQIVDPYDPVGLIGAYTIFEDVGDNLFYDMTYHSAVIAPKPDGGDDDSAAGDDSQDDHHLSKIVALPLMVDDSNGLVDAFNKHPGEVGIVYYLVSAGHLAQVALYGGTGFLEDYGNYEAVNQAAHARNLRVSQNLTLVYNAYVRGYQNAVRATKNEKELRKLGPPRAPYQMPAPANSTVSQREDLLSVQKTNEFDAWKTIADQINQFHKYPDEGMPFLRLKAKTGLNISKLYNKYKDWLRPGMPEASDKVAPIDYEIEGSLEIRKIGENWHAVTGSKQYVKANLKFQLEKSAWWAGETPGKYKLEFGLKNELGDPKKWKFAVVVGPFKSEVGSRAELKLAYEMIPDTLAVMSATSPVDAEFSSGFVLSFKGLAKKLREKQSAADGVSDYNIFLEALEKTEIEASIGFTGLYEETVLAIIIHAPGFFERRGLDELLDPNVQWNDLSSDEQVQLHELGWVARLWDGKYFLPSSQLPESVTKQLFDLTAPEKVAIVHLGFHRYEEYGKMFKEKRAQHVSEQPGAYFLPLPM